MPGHTERDFEKAIEAGLANGGGYEKRSPNAFDEALALFPGDVTGFLEDSQPAKWELLARISHTSRLAVVGRATWLAVASGGAIMRRNIGPS